MSFIISPDSSLRISPSIMTNWDPAIRIHPSKSGCITDKGHGLKLNTSQRNPDRNRKGNITIIHLII
jgi:hypothetical protein